MTVDKLDGNVERSERAAISAEEEVNGNERFVIRSGSHPWTIKSH